MNAPPSLPSDQTLMAAYVSGRRRAARIPGRRHPPQPLRGDDLRRDRARARDDRGRRQAARVPRLRGSAPAAGAPRADRDGGVVTTGTPCDEIAADAVGLLAL